MSACIDYVHFEDNLKKKKKTQKKPKLISNQTAPPLPALIFLSQAAAHHLLLPSPGRFHHLLPLSLGLQPSPVVPSSSQPKPFPSPWLKPKQPPHPSNRGSTHFPFNPQPIFPPFPLNLQPAAQQPHLPSPPKPNSSPLYFHPSSPLSHDPSLPLYPQRHSPRRTNLPFPSPSSLSS